jgi:hypothetical protein
MQLSNYTHNLTSAQNLAAHGIKGAAKRRSRSWLHLCTARWLTSSLPLAGNSALLSSRITDTTSSSSYNFKKPQRTSSLRQGENPPPSRCTTTTQELVTLMDCHRTTTTTAKPAANINPNPHHSKERTAHLR